MIWLRQSTAGQEVPLGYFLDSADGDSEETALTIANTDIKLWKFGATSLVSKNSGGATHMSNGVYYCTLDATDTATAGPLVIFVHVSGALTVRVECLVMTNTTYLALVTGGGQLTVNTGYWKGSLVATPATAGVPTVDAAYISGSATAADNAEVVFATDFATNYDTTNDCWQVDVERVRTSQTAANNIQTVFETDFATNYDSVNNNWQVDVERISGSLIAANNMEVVFDTDFATNYDAVNDQWDVSESAGAGAAASVNVKDVKDMIPGRPFATLRVVSDDTVDYLTDSNRNVDADGHVADVAYIQCASANDLRYAFDANPTQNAGGLGHDMSDGDKLTLYGNSQISKFRFTSAAAGAASAFIVTFFRSGKA